ncbi:MAG: hypothetical protein QF662_01905, partial [Phycisphaerae bacterium]|nr:hypothetical protein [Phycisphaerae bacterium]
MATASQLTFGNNYFALGIKGGIISQLRLDPTGRGRYGRNITKGFGLRYRGDETPDEKYDYLVPGWKIRATGKVTKSSAKRATGGARMQADFESTAGAGKAAWQITAKKNKLQIRVEGKNFRGIQLLTPWVKDGFNMKDPRILFSRVFTERGVHIPMTQFKRITKLGYLDANRWHGGKKLSKWTYLTGNGDFDLRITGYRRGINFIMDSDTMAVIFGADDKGVVNITIEVLPHTDQLPDCYPRFTASDENLAGLVTDFYNDRAFSYSNTSSSSSFNKVWVTDAMCWTDAPQNHEDREFIEDMPLGKTGWVYSHAPNNEYWPLGDYDVIDTRHYDTNGMYIVAARDHFMWHRDRGFLDKVLPKMRAAMKCQLEQQGGKDGILIDRRNKHQGFPRGVGDNYWDVLPFGYKEGYS